MPPNTWDHPTFAAQQSDIDEISAALPVLTARITTLRKTLSTLPTDSPARPTDATDPERIKVEEELAEAEAQVRGRLLMARECEEANRRMMECVCVEFLTRGEREVLGGLRVKLARILGEFGE